MYGASKRVLWVSIVPESFQFGRVIILVSQFVACKSTSFITDKAHERNVYVW